jgi:putative colanic acid biosynthesis acetyltransferase WcaF
MMIKNKNSYNISKNINHYTEPSFSLSNRSKRFIWNIFKCTIFKYSPRTFHQFRITILKLFGARVGKYCRVYNTTQIWAPWNLIMGNYVNIAEDVKVYNIAKIKIGDFSIISQGTFLCTGSHDYNSKNFQLYAKSIIIKKNIWICAETFVHPGVTIEDGVVIGARSVVTKTIKNKWSVYSGNPAKYKTKRKKMIK